MDAQHGSLVAPPYFDVLLDLLQKGDPDTTTAFGRHVHWGYWEDAEGVTVDADEYGPAAERLCNHVLDSAPIVDGSRVLDVGCGFGGAIANLNERFRGCAFTGVNIDERQLERARQEVRPQNHNRIEFRFADACQLPFAAESFDVVTAIECVFHFDRATFLQQAARVLVNGGVLALSDFLPPASQVSFLKAFDPRDDQATQNTYGAIHVLCPYESYCQLAAEAGLRLRSRRDVTENTLPTYAFLRQHSHQWPRAEKAQQFEKATARLEMASRTGLLRYEILTFEKPV